MHALITKDYVYSDEAAVKAVDLIHIHAAPSWGIIPTERCGRLLRGGVRAEIVLFLTENAVTSGKRQENKVSLSGADCPEMTLGLEISRPGRLYTA